MNRSFWLYFLFFFLTLVVSSQQSQEEYDVSYRFEKDSIPIKGGTTFSNLLILQNHSADSLVLTNVNPTDFPEGLIKLPDTIHLSPSEIRSLPLKFIADRRTIVQDLQEFSLSLGSNKTHIRVQPSASFITILEEQRSFKIYPDQSDYYLNPEDDQVQLLLRCVNTGLVPVDFELVFSNLPDGLEITRESQFTSLNPGEQVLLPITLQNTTNRNINQELNIEAFAATGDRLSLQRVRVMSIGSVQRFTTGNDWGGAPNNSVSLQYRSMNQQYGVYELQANGDLNFGEDKALDYRLNLQYNEALEGISMYNSYLDYQAESWGIKLGNIHANLDHSVGGRGLKATYKVNQDKRLSVYGVKNQYMLISPVGQRLPGEKMLAAEYAFKAPGNREGQLSFVHSNHKYRQVYQNQLSGKTYVNLLNYQSLWVEGGLSHEAIFNENGKVGVSAGFQYNYRDQQYQFNSNTYYSSPYYTGIRRGMLRSDNRMTRNLNPGQSLSARVSIMHSNPGYQEGERGYRLGRDNRIDIFELGYGRNYGNFHFDIKPYYMTQSLEHERRTQWQQFEGKWELNAIRNILNLRFSWNNHRFNLHTDYGYVFKNTSNAPAAPFHSLKINGNYSYKSLGLTTQFQINPYYLSDILSIRGNEKYRMFSFGPNTRFSTLNNKLQLQLSGMYSHYGYSGSDNFSLNGHVKWNLQNNWSLTGDVFYSMVKSRRAYGVMEDHMEYVDSRYDHNQIRVGVMKKFNQFLGSKGKKMELLYFQDHNNNGMKDPTEPGAEGVLVKIGKQAAQSDKDGKVKFLNMLPGAYRVDVVTNNGWSMAGSNELLLSGNLSLEMPLVRTKLLKGKIQVVANAYLESQAQLGGIRINAVDIHGRGYKTLSDAGGNYTLYLPASSYKVFIDTEGLPFSILNDTNELEIGESKDLYTLDFQYKDERRKVDVKRF